MSKSNSLTVGDLFGSDTISPMNIDTSEIKALSEAMPKDGNIDINNAEVLATKYLRGADVCAELLSIATAYVQKTDTLKKKAFSKAALENADKYFEDRNNGKKPDKITDKMRVLYADQDQDYLIASNNHSMALAFIKWIDSKYNSFNKMHYLCKKILDRGYAQEKMANFNGEVDNNDYETSGKEAEEPIDKKEDSGEEWWKE